MSMYLRAAAQTWSSHATLAGARAITLTDRATSRPSAIVTLTQQGLCIGHGAAGQRDGVEIMRALTTRRVAPKADGGQQDARALT